MTNEELCIKIQGGEKKYLKDLIENNQRLIYSLMKKFYISKNDEEDCYSCAKIALINAAHSFDINKGCLFSTYAVHNIIGEIKKYFRSNMAIHISRIYKDTYIKVQNALEILKQENQEVSLELVAKYLNIPLDVIILSCDAHHKMLSLDDMIFDNVRLSEVISLEEENLDLKYALSMLEKKERLIILLRYQEGLSQAEVAKRLYISQVHVSRLERAILTKLKKFMN